MMFKTYRKRRAPLAQLKAASKIANEVLSRKKVQAKDDIIYRLTQLPNPPKLPGLPPYLPRPYTLDWARVVMTIIVKKWIDANAETPEKLESVRAFTMFTIRRLEDEERKWALQMRSTDLKEIENETLAKIFLPVQAKETAEKLKTFIMDMFNKSAIVSQNGTVSELIDEFDQDTIRMKDLWVGEEKRLFSKQFAEETKKKRKATKSPKPKKRRNKNVHP